VNATRSSEPRISGKGRQLIEGAQGEARWNLHHPSLAATRVTDKAIGYVASLEAALAGLLDAFEYERVEGGGERYWLPCNSDAVNTARDVIDGAIATGAARSGRGGER
jgi:hypothetical protein